TKVGFKPIRIYPGSPWENGYNEWFNRTLRREVLNAEWFSTPPRPKLLSINGSTNITMSGPTTPSECGRRHPKHT
ncbi:MAG: transposase, partial [Alphaproteobacteria bacterium]|nr:transposase [Alphaproteobacteria bacterium]